MLAPQIIACMAELLVDGNNLLHAMHAHAPIAAVGRETMIKIIDRWARQASVRVLVVFDGGAPPPGLARQMSTSRVDVAFSAPKSADDVIAERLKAVRRPAGVRVISSDTAVRREATRRRCHATDCVHFIAELFPSSAPNADTAETSKSKFEMPSAADPADDKPTHFDKFQTEDWLRWLGLDEKDGTR